MDSSFSASTFLSKLEAKEIEKAEDKLARKMLLAKQNGTYSFIRTYATIC